MGYLIELFAVEYPSNLRQNKWPKQREKMAIWEGIVKWCHEFDVEKGV